MRTALVTGASRGVGRAAAHALSARGVRCILVSRDEAGLRETASGCESPTRVMPVDLGDRAAVSAMDVGDVDILVHAAAPTFSYEKYHDVGFETLDHQMQVNVGAIGQIASAVLPGMMLRRWGRVVLVGSLGGQLGGRGAAAYNMAKAALESVGRTIAVEYGRYRVTANTLVLSPIDGERLAGREAEYPGAREAMLQLSPARRLPTPEEVAEVVAWMSSEGSAPINGATIDVSWGSHLNASW